MDYATFVLDATVVLEAPGTWYMYFFFFSCRAAYKVEYQPFNLSNSQRTKTIFTPRIT